MITAVIFVSFLLLFLLLLLVFFLFLFLLRMYVFSSSNIIEMNWRIDLVLRESRDMLSYERVITAVIKKNPPPLKYRGY